MSDRTLDEWRWLQSTQELQAEHGYTVMPLEDVALAEFVRWNFLAAFAELGEAMGEVDWKPWSQGQGRVNKDALTEELVDVTHFIGNILVAVGVTESEFWTRYRLKQAENFRRVREGYTARLGT